MILNYFDPNQKVRVAVYARVSTEHEEQLSALENQIQYYDSIVDQHENWLLVHRYIDKGITGTSIQKRPAFLEMMEDAENDQFDLIITREVSRFARNTADTLVQVRVLLGYKVIVFFTEDHIWTDSRIDDDWELKLSIMAMLAQNESKKISSRVKAGQKISFENGVPYGNGNILGYDKDKITKQMVINAEQARTVKRIFDLYLGGAGLRKIQDILEEEGYKSSSGKVKWHSAVISKVLKNPFYCGVIVYRKQYVPDYLVQKKINNNGEVEQIVVQGNHEPIISKEDFDKVQEMIKGKTIHINGKTVGKQISKDVFSRKMICKCGHAYNRRLSYRAKDPKDDTYYRQCYSQLRSGTIAHRKKIGLPTEGICDAMGISDWQLKVTADWIFRKFFDNKQIIYNKIMELMDECLGEDDYIQKIINEMQETEQRIEKLNNKMMALVDLYTDGNIPKEMYLTKKEEVQNKLEKENERIEILTNEKKQAEEDSDLVRRKTDISDFLLVNPLKWDEAINEELIEAFVDHIVVHEDHMDWVLRMPYDANGNCTIPVHDKRKTRITSSEDSTYSVKQSTGCYQCK